jgi:F0F1-type ATP synthase membrane subunit a
MIFLAKLASYHFFTVWRWDITATEALPEYMQMCCLALFESVDSQANEVLEKKGLNVTPYLRRAVIILIFHTSILKH